MPHEKMLERLVSTFGLEPRSLCRRKSLLTFQPAPGAEVAWLDKKAVERCQPAYRERFVVRFRGWVEVQSSDNASYYRHTSPGLSQGARTELSHQTAIGSMFLPARSGCARPDVVRALSHGPPCYIVPSSGHGRWSFAAVAVLERGKPCSFPPDGQCLPTDPAEFARVKALFTREGEFKPVLHDVVKHASEYLNFTDAPAPQTNVNETDVITLWLKERLRHEHVQSYLAYGALDDVSTPAPPRRKTMTLVRRGGVVVREATGLRAHSKEVYPGQWAADGCGLEKAVILPYPGLPFNSLSKVGQLGVQLHLHDVALDPSLHPGWYHLARGGDGFRTFYQGDGGSENVMFSNYTTAVKRIWRATLAPHERGHARYYKPFADEVAARAHILVLRKILVHDPLPAPMHNGMIIGKSILVPHEAIGAPLPAP